MEEKLINLIYSYEICNRYADEAFVEQAVDIIADYYDVKDCIKSLDVKSNLLSGNSGLYDSVTNKLTIYLLSKREVMPLYNIIYDGMANSASKTLLVNLNILETIFHELDHALIEKERKEKKDNISVKLYSYTDYDLRDKPKNVIDKFKNTIRDKRLDYIYVSNHDIAPLERRAIVSSNAQTAEITKQLGNTDIDEFSINIKLTTLELLFIKDICNVYKMGKDGITNSPSYDYCKKIKSIKKYAPNEVERYSLDRLYSYEKDSNKFGVYNRILYGLQLSNDELQFLIDNSAVQNASEPYKKLNKYFK